METGLEIFTLGGVKIQLGGEPVDRLTNQKAIALLIYLASTRRRQSREVLADLLWDERSQSQVLANLRGVLVSLRKWFGDQVIISRSNVSINPDLDIRLDSSEFETALQPWVAARGAITAENAAEVIHAVELYRGEFLEGFYLQAASGFEAWLVRERQRLHHKLVEALGGLVDYELRQGAYPLGAEHARRLLGLDPLMESAQRQLMRLLAYSGQRAAALEAYERFRDLLEDELSVDPEVETQTLNALIQAGELGKPALPAHSTSPHNLPAQLTSFIGRQSEIADVSHLLTGSHSRQVSPSRLVTLLGAGGSGKTRLSLQAANAVLAAYPHGAWLVELASLTDPDLVPQAALKALDLRTSGERLPMDVLVQYLAEKQMLLVFDNCEHLIDACAAFIEKLLRACPRVSVLATSRERLNIPGETVFHVPTLSMPAGDHPLTAAKTVHYEAVQLFVERGASASPGFAISDDNAQAIAQICSRLDGIPLAIELAAARLNVLTPAGIASRLDDCFQLLGGGSRTALPRQQTLRATIDWSYELLSEKERYLLRRLAVFAGSWTLEAAETICKGEEIEQPEILELFSSLVNKSMVAANQFPGREMRYSMLETIRQYGRERLREAGEELWFTSQHLAYFLALAERSDHELRGPHSLEWTRRMEREYDNLRAALEWSLGTCQAVELGLQLSNALHMFWDRVNNWYEARLWMERALADSQALGRTAVRARALANHAIFVGEILGDLPQARLQLEESLEILRELSTASRLDYAYTLMWLGYCLGWLGDYDTGRDYLEHSCEIFQEAGESWWQASALVYLSGISKEMLDKDTIVIHLEEAADLFRKTGERWGLAYPLWVLGNIAMEEGDDRAASQHIQACLAIFQDFNSIGWVGRMLHTLGELARCMNEYDQALAYYQESLAMYQQCGFGSYWFSMVTQGLGYVAIAHADNQLAASRFKEALKMVEASDPTTQSMHSLYCLAGFAAVVACRGEAESAACAFGTVAAQMERIQAERISGGEQLSNRADLLEFDRYQALCRAQLDEGVFAAAWAWGQNMEMDQAVDLILEVVG